MQQRGEPFSSFMADTTNSRILRGYVFDRMSRIRGEFDRVGIGKAAQSLVSQEAIATL